jgi:hypothetical protein
MEQGGSILRMGLFRGFGPTPCLLSGLRRLLVSVAFLN